MTKYIFEENDPIVAEDDAGCSLTMEISSPDIKDMFVRICSWDEDQIHPDFIKLEGKCVRVTVEVID